LGTTETNAHARLAQARNAWRRVLSLGVCDFETCMEAARICAWIGPVQEAIDLYGKAIMLRPDHADIHYELSECLAHNGQILEASQHLKIAVTLNPQVARTAVKDLQELLKLETPSGKAICGRYPTTDEIRNDLRATILNSVAKDIISSTEPFIRPDTVFFTMGSCFARNLARTLRKHGYDATDLPIAENINSTFANRALVDWMMGRANADLAERIEDLFNGTVSRQNLIDYIAKADVFIFTLGVAPCFFDRTNGRYILPRPTAINTRALAGKYKFRTTSVRENVENAYYVIDCIQRINPDCHVVVTVSPVPLQMSFEMEAVVAADCLSKSTLRVTAHELLQMDLPRLSYWPSFEIVRWLGSHIGPVFGTEDDSSAHVSESLVELIVSTFLDVFSGSSIFLG
ncbi:MAG: GSCFA domain-containing protein, partial [Rhodospirillales bacterium]|nr:GSCFA domain-containing protein [Rhodospirillales bacterium]